jgi:aspartate aminotransferase-like enzyme
MSRGHGWIEQAILKHQKEQHERFPHPYPRWQTLRDVAHGIFYPWQDDEYTPPTRAQIESTRRAVKRLAAEGLIECQRRHWDNRRQGKDWGASMLSIRLVPTADEKGAEQAERNQRARRIAAVMRGEA